MSWLKIPFELLADSKKVRALLAGLIMLALLPLAEKFDVAVTSDQVSGALLLLATYIIGQGIADNGKEKALVELAADVEPDEDPE